MVSTGRRFTEVGEIRDLILRHPREAFGGNDRIDAQWRDLNFLERPDFDRAIEEYDRLVELVAGEGVNIHFLPGGEWLTLDSLYVRDAMVFSPDGMILGNMGKSSRRAEPEAAAAYLRDSGIAVRGAINGDGRLEGGDVVWLDDRTVAVGQGYRTNGLGIRQFQELLGGGVEVKVVPLPHWKGPEDVFHLMSVISPLDHDLALVHSPLMPAPFREWLLGRGMRLVEVAPGELDTLGGNVLATAPRRAVMVAGNPATRALLEAEGVQVQEFEGREIAWKGSGGPTCLTRPLVRG